MRIIVFLSVLLLFFSCKKDYIVQSSSSKDFSGTYTCVIKDSVIEMQYDSIGNQVGVFYKANFYTDTIIISRISGTDSFLVKNLRGYSKHNCRAAADNDKLLLNSDWSDFTHSRWLRGELVLKNDNLSLDYKWNNFDTWSTGALPHNGFTTGNGSR